MTQLRLKNAVIHNGIYYPSNKKVEVDDTEVPALLKLGAYDVKPVGFPVDEVFVTEKPRKRGKK